MEHVRFVDNRVQTSVPHSPWGLPISVDLPSIGMEEGGGPLPGVFYRKMYTEPEAPPPPQAVTQIPVAVTPVAEPRQEPQLAPPPIPAPIMPNEKLVIAQCLRNPEKIKELEEQGGPGKRLSEKIRAMPEWAGACSLYKYLSQQEADTPSAQAAKQTCQGEEAPPLPLNGAVLAVSIGP